MVAYTAREWDEMMDTAETGFARHLRDETVWMFGDRAALRERYRWPFGPSQR